MRPLPGHAAPFLLALTLAAAPAWGQRLGGLRDSFATLPESNDALVLTSRLAEAVEAGEYRVAIELAEQMMALPPGLVGAPASRTFYPVRRHAIRLLRRFPPEAVRAYRQIYDAKVEALLARAREASDEAALESLFWSYPLSTHWSDVGLELAARRIDRGAFDEAVSILAEMSAGATSPDPRVEMQLAAALEASGAASAARAVLERLAARDMGGDALLAGRLRELQRWFALRRAEDPQAVHAYAPRLLIGPAWSVALGPAGNGAPPFSAEALIEAALDERRTPLQDPVLAGRTLLVRLRGAVWAIDASTLAILWTRREYKAEGVTFASGRFLDGVSPDEDGRPAEVRALLQSWLAHVISADEARVYTVEGLPDGAQLDDAGPWGRQFGAPRIGVGNELVARDLKTGATVWRTGAMRDHPLFGVEFQDRPVALDGRLLAPIRRENELKLVAIAPATGELLHEQVVLGLPTALPEERGNSQIAADDAGVYVVSGTGVTAAWDRDSLAWRWATVYPSALAEQLGRLWWQQARGQHSVRYDRPVLVGDLLIAAPPDSDEILAFDRFDGEQRWSLPRKEYPLVIGACEAGLVLANQVLVCLDADDPRGVPPKWRSVPLALTGRPAIRGERIFAPTRDGLVVVDARTGRVIVDQASGAAAQGYAGGGARGAPRLSQLYSSAAAGLAVSTIVCGPQATFAVSPLGVVKYPDVEATQRRAAHENAERDWLELAWLDLIAGDLDAALACVQQVSTAALDEPAQAASRRLLLEIYVAKANAVEDVEQRLRWLRRAAELPVDAPVAARLRTWIGSELESLGRWEECIEHYARLVLAGEDALVARSADSRHRTAEWAYAADRLGAALREASEATAAGAADDLLAGAGDRPDALLRVRRALRDRPERRRVDETLLLSRIAPELAELVLVPDDPGQPLLRRRQLHIARWYTYVSLAMLPEAREAAALWENELGRDLPVAGEEALDELSAERLASLELALRKISSLGGAAFTPALDRVWRVKGGELLLDPRDERLTRNWIPIRAFEKPFLQLIEITKNEFPWRQVDDGLSRSIAPRALLVEETHRALYGRERGAPQRSAWPLARHRALAAAVGGGRRGMERDSARRRAADLGERVRRGERGARGPDSPAELVRRRRAVGARAARRPRGAGGRRERVGRRHDGGRPGFRVRRARRDEARRAAGSVRERAGAAGGRRHDRRVDRAAGGRVRRRHARAALGAGVRPGAGGVCGDGAGAVRVSGTRPRLAARPGARRLAAAARESDRRRHAERRLDRGGHAVRRRARRRAGRRAARRFRPARGLRHAHRRRALAARPEDAGSAERQPAFRAPAVHPGAAGRRRVGSRGGPDGVPGHPAHPPVRRRDRADHGARRDVAADVDPRGLCARRGGLRDVHARQLP